MTTRSPATTAASSEREAAWEARLGELREFVSSHGHRPSSTSESTEERGLSAWVYRTRSRHTTGKRREDLETVLAEATPRWRGLEPKRWRERADQLEAFVTASGRRPRLSGAAHERSLAAWLQAQPSMERRAGDASELSERWAHLDAIFPAWRPQPAPALRAPLSRPKAPPRGKVGPVPSARIAKILDSQGAINRRDRIYGRLRDLRADGATTDAEETTLREADRLLGDGWWRTRAEEVWDLKLGEVSAFIEGANRYPAASATTDEERQLAVWIRAVRQAALNDEQTRKLDAALPGWSKHTDATWHIQLRRAQAFLAASGKLPEAGSTDANEGDLARWLGKQRHTLSGSGASPSMLERRNLLDATLPGWNVARSAPDVSYRAHPSEAWKARAEEAAVYVERQGAFPSYRSSDQATRALAGWLMRNRYSHISKAKKKYLDEIVPGWDNQLERNWQVIAREVADFIAAHERWPSATVSEERKFAKWLRDQRLAFEGKGHIATSPERRAILDATIPGWREKKQPTQRNARPTPTPKKSVKQKPEPVARAPRRVSEARESAWQAKADRVATFFAENGAYPAQHSPDPDTRSLAAWLSITRNAVLAPARKAYFDSVLPGWTTSGGDRKREAKWKQTAAEVAAFVSTNDRMPRYRNGTPEERALAEWVGDQRLAAEGRGHVASTEERREILDATVPGWRDRQPTPVHAVSDSVWQERAAAAVGYYAEHGAYPALSATDAEVRSLGEWLKLQRYVASADQKAHLDRVLPGWRNRREVIWAARASAVALFVSENGRFPRHSVVSERPLAGWLANQRTAADGRGVTISTPARRATLDATIPGWRQPGSTAAARAAVHAEETEPSPSSADAGIADPAQPLLESHLETMSPWEERAEQLRDYIRENGRWPERRMDGASVAEHKIWEWARAQLVSAAGNEKRWTAARELVMVSIDSDWRSQAGKKLTKEQRRAPENTAF